MGCCTGRFLSVNADSSERISPSHTVINNINGAELGLGPTGHPHASHAIYAYISGDYGR